MDTSPAELLADTQAALDRTCSFLEDAGRIAFDTEFVRESTYFAKLCLIQLATDKVTVCIDCLAATDMGALWQRLLRPDLALVAHSARQDLELIWQTTGARPARVLDTQIAAALLGYPPQIGLRELLLDVLGIEIEKTMSRTDWSKRPLSAEALHYAATDVLHLLPLWRVLEQRLAERGRAAWFDEDAARALEVSLETDLVLLYQRTKGSGRLRGAEIDAALALLAWREQRARESDRPRRWILADDVLVALAQSRPRDKRQLAQTEGLSRRTAERRGEAMLAALADAQAGRFAELAAACVPAERPDAAALKALQSHVRAQAEALGIEPEVLAARRDLVATVLGDPPAHLTSGWRSEVLDIAGAGRPARISRDPGRA